MKKLSLSKHQLSLSQIMRFKFSQKIKPTNLILIRHAQSVFNALCHKYPDDKIYGKEAQEQFHHDPEIIDCSLTESGHKSFKKDQIIKHFQHHKPQNTLFFVSPMLRTLQTTKMILTGIGRNYDVKVIPQLSEVLSKICDFCSGIQNKKKQFPQFDFTYLDEWMLAKGLCQKSENWQDPFVDLQLRDNLDLKSAAGRRYLKMLKQRFPKALQSPQNCNIRSIEGLNKIYQISNLLKIKNAVVVSHNRILKNVQAHIVGKQVQDFDNLQIRKIKIADHVHKTLNK